MCSIIASFNPYVIYRLIKQNEHRGVHSYSILKYDFVRKSVLSLERGFGVIPYTSIDQKNVNLYQIVHQQAPTTVERGFGNIHPAQIDEELLWHNGMLKHNNLLKLRRKIDSSTSWDTKLILEYIKKREFEYLELFEGSFACVYFDSQDFFVFRNQIAPLYIDDDLNISSTQFLSSRELPNNKIFKLNFEPPFFVPHLEFKNVETPYYFPQEN